MWINAFGCSLHYQIRMKNTKFKIIDDSGKEHEWEYNYIPLEKETVTFKGRETLVVKKDFNHDKGVLNIHIADVGLNGSIAM